MSSPSPVASENQWNWSQGFPTPNQPAISGEASDMISPRSISSPGLLLPPPPSLDAENPLALSPWPQVPPNADTREDEQIRGQPPLVHPGDVFYQDECDTAVKAEPPSTPIPAPGFRHPSVYFVTQQQSPQPVYITEDSWRPPSPLSPSPSPLPTGLVKRRFTALGDEDRVICPDPERIRALMPAALSWHWRQSKYKEVFVEAVDLERTRYWKQDVQLRKGMGHLDDEPTTTCNPAELSIKLELEDEPVRKSCEDEVRLWARIFINAEKQSIVTRRFDTRELRLTIQQAEIPSVSQLNFSAQPGQLGDREEDWPSKRRRYSIHSLLSNFEEPQSAPIEQEGSPSPYHGARSPFTSSLRRGLIDPGCYRDAKADPREGAIEQGLEHLPMAKRVTRLISKSFSTEARLVLLHGQYELTGLVLRFRYCAMFLTCRLLLHDAEGRAGHRIDAGCYASPNGLA